MTTQAAEHRQPRPATRLGFEIAVICALPIEADAVRALFDLHWDDDGLSLGKALGDPNAYSTGTVGHHNVVLAHMAGMGTNNAAIVAVNCQKSFPNIKLALVVGVCGVRPFGPEDEDIFLGDVVISDAVIQYDLGRQLPDRFVIKDTLLDSLGRPNLEIRMVLAKLKTIQCRQQLGVDMANYLGTLHDDPRLAAKYPGVSNDRLFEAKYRHLGNTEPCEKVGCDSRFVKRRRPQVGQDDPRPAVHFGLIASGNSVMKSGEDRDAISEDKDVIAFEMESAGVWNILPCVVIKGACDYADSHKSKLWQRYSSATAAACMKAFLRHWTPSPAIGMSPEQPPGTCSLDSRQKTENWTHPNSNASRTAALKKLSEECQRSLGFPQIQDRYHGIGRATSRTCEWLLRHEKYRNWTACDNGLLWMKGKPGSGKSTLLKYALDNCPASKEDLVLSFFFHGRGEELQRTPLGLFRSLLHQILGKVPNALQDLLNTFEKNRREIGNAGKAWNWHPDDLELFLESSLLKVLESRPVWLFIDALDECGQENAVKLIGRFKSLLRSQFHICFACRHYPILDQGGAFEVCLEHENQNDISTYVQERLHSIPKLMKSVIPDLVTDRANGIFLWVYLVVNQALKLELEGATAEEIKAEVVTVPLDLDRLYQDLIQKMGPVSLKLIQWICCATRPLSLDELRWAMAIEADCPHQTLQDCRQRKDYVSDNQTMEKRVRSLSCGLAEVSVTFEMKSVQFIHQSVMDFFVDKGLSALQGNATSAPEASRMAHFRLSRICIRYLVMEEIVRSVSHTEQEFPFLSYAAGSWVTHTAQSDAKKPPQLDVLELFAWPSRTLVDVWNRVYDALITLIDQPPARVTLAHIAARYQVEGLLRAIIQSATETGANIDNKDGEGRTPLWYAVGTGNETIVTLLIDEGADIESATPSGMTPLLHASRTGNHTIFRLLLNRGANVDVKDEEGRTPLWYAVGQVQLPLGSRWADWPIGETAHENIVRLLLDNGAKIDSPNHNGQTLLSCAVIRVHRPLITLLLSEGADTKLADQHGRTPLSWAAEMASVDIIRLLLDNGADVEFADDHGRTPLSYAVIQGDKYIITLLLSKGADTKLADQHGRTPLSWAAEKASVAIVRLLLDNGADVEFADDHGRTPLSYAASRGDMAIVDMFLSKGADTKLADQHGRTPLSWAVEKASEDIIRLLLDNGADVEFTDDHGRTPLSYAVIRADKPILTLLLSKGADTKLVDQHGRTLLSWAVEKASEDIIRLLLENGADVEFADDHGRTPLSYAASRGEEAIVAVLLSREASVDPEDHFGRTALSWAAKGGHERIIRLLLSKDADFEIQDEEGRTPLSWASGGGSIYAVRLLLDQGIGIDIADRHGRTPLSWAAQGGNEYILRLLISEGADIELADRRGRKPLWYAAGKGKVANLQLLLDMDARIEWTDSEGWPLMHWLITATPIFEYGKEATLRLLISKGANIESVDAHGRSLLSWAAGEGYEDAVLPLLRNGANIDLVDKYGRTSLSWAAGNGHVDIVRLLLDKGSKTELSDRYGRTPLSWAAWKGNVVIVWLLLSKGADVKSEDQKGRTPLWYAEWEGHRTVIDLLKQVE